MCLNIFYIYVCNIKVKNASLSSGLSSVFSNLLTIFLTPIINAFAMHYAATHECYWSEFLVVTCQLLLSKLGRKQLTGRTQDLLQVAEWMGDGSLFSAPGPAAPWAWWACLCGLAWAQALLSATGYTRMPSPPLRAELGHRKSTPPTPGRNGPCRPAASPLGSQARWWILGV